MAEELDKVLSAARDGDINTLQSLRRSVPFATDSFGATALHHATRYGKLGCIHWMVDKVGLKAQAKAKNGATALHDACTQGKLLCVKFFIQECSMNPDVSDNSGHTPLHLAARFGYVDIVKWMINKAKCNPRLKTMNRMNAVHFAAAGGHFKCLEFLISSGNSILLDERATDGTTPIFLATQNGHFPCLKYLHTVGAKCDLRSRDGMHLIHAAAQNGHLDCIGYLVVNGIACETEEDSTGAIPAHYAAGEGHVPVLKWLNKRSDVNIKDQLGGTPLHDASEKGQFAVIQYLVENTRLNIKLKDKSNLSPIDLADKYGHKRCHEYLTEAVAKSNVLKATKMMTYSYTFDKQTVEENSGSSFLHVLKKKSRQMDRPHSPSSATAPSLSPLYCSPEVSPRASPIPCMIEYGKASEWGDIDGNDVSKHNSEVDRSLEDHPMGQRAHLLDTGDMKRLSPLDDYFWIDKSSSITPTHHVDAYSNNDEDARQFDARPLQELTEEMLIAAKKRTRFMDVRLQNGNPTPSPLHEFDTRSGETAARNLQEFTSKIQAARANRSPHSTINKNDYQVLNTESKEKETENEIMEVKGIEKESVQNGSPLECNDVIKPVAKTSSFEKQMLNRSPEQSPRPIALNPSPPIPKTLTDIFANPTTMSNPEPSPSRTPNQPSPSRTPNQPSPSRTPNQPSPSRTPNQPSPSRTPNQPSPSRTPNQPSPSRTPNQPNLPKAPSPPLLQKSPTDEPNPEPAPIRREPTPQNMPEYPVRGTSPPVPKTASPETTNDIPVQSSKPLEPSSRVESRKESEMNDPPIDEENYMTTDDETEKSSSLPRHKKNEEEHLPLRKRQLQPLPHMTSPSKFGSQHPIDEDTWRTLPEWKRQVLRNRIMKEQQTELENRKQDEDESNKYAGLPAWKVPIVQRKESDRMKQEERLAHLPEWKRQLIQKKQG